MNKMKREIIKIGVMAVLLATTVITVSALQDPFPLDGYVVYENGTPVGAGANITFTNLNTSEVIYDDTSASGWYSQDAANFPSGYQDGQVIKYETVFGSYTNTTYYTINVAEGSHTMNITVHAPTGGNASVSVSDGSISFGNLQLNTVKNTVDIGDTQTISTAGAGGAQKIEIKLNSSTVIGINNGTTLTFVTGSPSTNEIKCEFKGGDVSSYTALTTTYQTFDDSMPANSTANLDIQLTTPSAVSNDNYYDSYQFEIIIRATLL